MNSRKRLLVGLSFLLLAVMLVGAANAYAAPVKVRQCGQCDGGL